MFCSSSARGDRRVPLIRCTPSFPNGLFSHHSNRDNSLQDYPSFAGETVGTRIDRDNSLIMPLRLRGGYATECHAFSYYTSSSALIFSPPCGSHPEYAHSVYKYALNKCSFGCGCPARNCNKVAISLAQSANITVAIGNNITHTLRAYHLHCRCGSESVFEQAHTVYKNAPNRLKSSATVRRTISR